MSERTTAEIVADLRACHDNCAAIPPCRICTLEREATERLTELEDDLADAITIIESMEDYLTSLGEKAKP
jgi:hypothetical protein